jgi:hypothetical protein
MDIILILQAIDELTGKGVSSEESIHNEETYNQAKWEIGVNETNDILFGDWSEKPTWQQVLDVINNAQYARDRAEAYPSIADQLDKIYHSGVAGWKADIKVIKDANPKP